MKEYWEENLHVLDRQGLVRKLERISEVFNALPLPKKHAADQLHFIIEEGCDALNIGLSKIPAEQLLVLQKDRHKSLMLLYYYDPMAEQKRLKETLSGVKISREFQSPIEAKIHQINWLRQDRDPGPVSDWFRPDDRALQILIKKGKIHLKELMTGLGLDYGKA